MPKQSEKRVFSAAWATTMKYLSKHYFKTLFSLVVMLVLQAACFVPLCAYLFFREWLVMDIAKWVLWLTPALCLLLLLPWRFSTAGTLTRGIWGENDTGLGSMLSLRGYAKRWHIALRQALRCLPFMVPLLLGLGAIVYGLFHFGGPDFYRQSFTSLTTYFIQLSRHVGQIFGEGPRYMEGIALMAGGLLLLTFVFMYGCKRNGMVRYLYTPPTTPSVKFFFTEEKRRLRGKRGGQLLVILVQLVCWLPLLLVVFYLANQMENILGNLFPDVALLAPSLPLVIGAVVIYLLLMPLRKVLPAAFIQEAK